MELFDGVLPLSGEGHPPGIVTQGPSPSPGPMPSALGPTHGPCGVAAFHVTAGRRVGVHLDHVVAVHGGCGTHVLLRLGLLVAGEARQGRRHAEIRHRHPGPFLYPFR